jgi:hypothetical protein
MYWKFPAPCFLFLSLVLPAFTPAKTVAQQIDPNYISLPVFEFHSGFWFNLHHTLYQEARQRLEARSAHEKNSKPQPAQKMILGTTALTSTEQQAWNDAVSYYATNYAEKDLLFSTELIQLKNQLADFEECDELSGVKKKTCNAGLPARLTQVLEEAAPVYRSHRWSEDDRANRRWVLGVAPLVREQSVGLSEHLADVYRTQWPKAKIRVDVSAYANWAGAYTTLDPLRVTISSTDSRNQSDAALEVLFHEASHGIAETVENAIIRECRQREKAIPRDLWHALIFYTTGEVIKPILASAEAEQGGGSEAYTPYAIREGLYQRGWETYLQLLTRFWQPYLDGKASFDDAIARMVSAL